MNRRSFFTKLAVAAAGFAILPPATTYDRIWKPTGKIGTFYAPNPEWVTAPFEMVWVGNWEFQKNESINWDKARFKRVEGRMICVPRYIEA